MNAPNPQPAWYPDPTGAPGLRYWDGQRWTEHIHDQTRAPADSMPSGGYPMPASGYPQPQGYPMAQTGPDGASRFQIRLTRHTGWLIMFVQRRYTFTGTLDECERAYRNAQIHNLLAGWWGFLSVLVMNWIALFSNMSSIRRLRRIAQHPPASE